MEPITRHADWRGKSGAVVALLCQRACVDSLTGAGAYAERQRYVLTGAGQVTHQLAKPRPLQGLARLAPLLEKTVMGNTFSRAAEALVMSNMLGITFDIGILIAENNHWLGGELTDLAHEALSAHEERKYLLAVNRAGVCLEAVLRRMLHGWSKPPDPRATLGQLIGAIRDAGRAAETLADRLQEANLIRNRSAHDRTGQPAQASLLNTITVGDSLQILSILALAVDWYGQSLRQSPEPLADAIPVFLSVGGPHRLDQQQFIQRLRLEMHQMGVVLHRLNSDDFSRSAPFDQIAELLASCRAALIVGLDRSHAYAVFEREKSKDQKIRQEQYTPTAWNQIEGSMASALRLPILILREHRLHQEGVFEAKNHRHHILDFDLQAESKGLSAELRRFLAGWVNDIRTGPGPGHA